MGKGKSSGFSGGWISSDTKEYKSLFYDWMDDNDSQLLKGGGLASPETFYAGTDADFTETTLPSELKNRKPDYESASGSRYWYTDEGVYRQSDHWGKNVATASWRLRGKSADKNGEFSNDYSSGDSWKIPTGYAKWSDFSRKKDDWVGAIRSSASPFSEGYWQVFKHLTFDEARNGITYKGQKVKFKYDRRGGGWEAKI